MKTGIFNWLISAILIMLLVSSCSNNPASLAKNGKYEKCQKAIKSSKLKKQEELFIESGRIAFINKDTDWALTFFEAASKLVADTKFYTKHIEGLKQYANKNYLLALENFYTVKEEIISKTILKEAIPIYEKEENWFNLARIYELSGDQSKTELYYLKAADIAMEKEGYKNAIDWYIKGGDKEKAEKAEKAEKSKNELNKLLQENSKMLFTFLEENFNSLRRGSKNTQSRLMTLLQKIELNVTSRRLGTVIVLTQLRILGASKEPSDMLSSLLTKFYSTGDTKYIDQQVQYSNIVGRYTDMHKFLDKLLGK